MATALVILDVILIDGTGERPFPVSSLSIEDGLITSIRRDATRPEGIPTDAQVIDGRGRWVIPGLWDTHFHHCWSGGGRALSEEWYPAPRAWQWNTYLQAGVTSVVSTGDVPSEIFQAREAERTDQLRAPRIFAAGPVLTAPGGHPLGTVFRDHPAIAADMVREVDSVEAARSEVRTLLAFRPDFIKAVYSGPLPAARLKSEVLAAIVDEAHGSGLRVLAHIGFPREALGALRAGVDGLEHMVIGNDAAVDDAIAAAVSSGVTWTPTLSLFSAFDHRGDDAYADEWFPEESPSFVRGSLGHERSRWLEPPSTLLAATIAATGRAHRAGVRLAVGTDAGHPAVFHGSTVHLELSLLVAAGLSPLEAITAATSNAAAKLGLESRLGSLKIGMEADLTLLGGDPLVDILNTRLVQAVVKRGRLV